MDVAAEVALAAYIFIAAEITVAVEITVLHSPSPPKDRSCIHMAAVTQMNVLLMSLQPDFAPAVSVYS